jgi:hypothetical protein
MDFFSEQELAHQAEGNAAAIFLVTAVYLKEQGLETKGWTEHLGKVFSPTWDESCASSAKETVRLMARNIVSMGGTLERIDGDAHRATGTVTWPPSDLLAEFGASPEEADSVWDVYQPIAEHLGVDYEWHRSGPAVEVSVALRS